MSSVGNGVQLVIVFVTVVAIVVVVGFIRRR
jgi:hypothetical protein